VACLYASFLRSVVERTEWVQTTGDRRQKSEVRRQKTEDRRQEPEFRRQNDDDRIQEAE